ncbi:hypothetical protein SFRURICE_009655 [Spodoptera frugiperda]|nr:hypothetical protein SFRURICE_009655 [Spodoptera frugiperda]
MLFNRNDQVWYMSRAARHLNTLLSCTFLPPSPSGDSMVGTTMRSAGLRSTSPLVTRTSPSASGSTCVTLPLGQVLRGRSGSEVTTTSPTLGGVLLPRAPAGFKGAAGTHVPIFAKSATPVVRASSLKTTHVTHYLKLI